MFKQLFPVLLIPLILVGAGCTQPQQAQPQPVSENVQNTATPVVLADGTYLLDMQTGLLNWEAEKVVATHNGTVRAQEGTVIITDGQVTAGGLIMDMNSIQNLDLTDEKMNATLVGHLKSDDFFAVATNPTAVFTITQVVPVEGLEGATHRITGKMMIKGIENEISFPATLKTTDEGIQLVATIELDRTLWDIRYGSEKFFDNLGDNLIKDTFTLKADMLFKAAQVQ